MRGGSWHRQWVYGVYPDRAAAENFIRQAEASGVAVDELLVLEPEQYSSQFLVDVPVESHHPEMRWVLIGIALGYFISHFMAVQPDIIRDSVLPVVVGFGVAIIGALQGIVWSASDTSLNALYEEGGVEGKYLVAIRCSPNNLRQIREAEAIVQRSGVMPRELPALPHAA